MRNAHTLVGPAASSVEGCLSMRVCVAFGVSLPWFALDQRSIGLCWHPWSCDTTLHRFVTHTCGDYVANAVETQVTLDSPLQGWAGATRHRLSMRSSASIAI